MDKIELARIIATGAHYGQVDKGGSPYIGHPSSVASMVDEGVEEIVAWLHDTVEDTNITLSDIEELFGKEVRDAVDAITRRKGEDRSVYLKRVKDNPIAKNVKVADLMHNSDLGRIKYRPLTQADYDRTDRYLREIIYLTNMEDE